MIEHSFWANVMLELALYGESILWVGDEQLARFIPCGGYWDYHCKHDSEPRSGAGTQMFNSEMQAQYSKLKAFLVRQGIPTEDIETPHDKDGNLKDWARDWLESDN